MKPGSPFTVYQKSVLKFSIEFLVRTYLEENIMKKWGKNNIGYNSEPTGIEDWPDLY